MGKNLISPILGRSKTNCGLCIFYVIYVFTVTILLVNQVSSLEEKESEILTELESTDTEVLSKDEDSARKLLDKLEQEVHAECQNRAMKEWLYATNLTSENRKAAVSSTFLSY